MRKLKYSCKACGTRQGRGGGEGGLYHDDGLGHINRLLDGRDEVGHGLHNCRFPKASDLHKWNVDGLGVAVSCKDVGRPDGTTKRFVTAGNRT